jgi:hypothetical protein
VVVLGLFGVMGVRDNEKRVRDLRHLLTALPTTGSHGMHHVLVRGRPDLEDPGLCWVMSGQSTGSIAAILD